MVARTDISLLAGRVDSSLIRLIRRSGQVVPWNSSKIEVAIRKAFLSFTARTLSLRFRCLIR
jgi:hypothetical protein